MLLTSNRKKGVVIVWKALLVIRILFMSQTKANSALSISVKLITPEILYPTPI